MSADRDAALKLVSISRETLQRIEAFLDLLQRWQVRTNLISPSTLPLVWTRHVADSVQLLRMAPQAATWIDIGSGGGFPGVILACALAECAGGKVHLVERNGKKAAFLREALRACGGAGQVHQGNFSDLADALPKAVDAITARAVGPLDQLLRMAAPWLIHGATGLFPKGQDVAGELDYATLYWDFQLQRVASLTGSGTIIKITRFCGHRSF